MQVSTLTATLTDFIQTSPLNRVHDLADLQLFDSPLLGVASADDELFPQLRQPAIIIETYLLPTDWLPQPRASFRFFCHSLRRFALPIGSRDCLRRNGCTDGLKARRLSWRSATCWWIYSGKVAMKLYFLLPTPDLRLSIAAATGLSGIRRSLPGWEPSA